MDESLDVRVARLEERMRAIQEDISEMKRDIKFLKENLVSKEEYRYIQAKVNGLALSTATMSGKLNVIVQWVAQGGIVGGTVLVVLRIATAMGLL